MCLACGLLVFHDHPRARPKHHLIGSALCRSRGGKQPRWQAVMSARKLLINKLPEPNATATATAAAAAAGAAAAAAARSTCCCCCCCCCCSCCCWLLLLLLLLLQLSHASKWLLLLLLLLVLLQTQQLPREIHLLSLEDPPLPQNPAVS